MENSSLSALTVGCPRWDFCGRRHHRPVPSPGRRARVRGAAHARHRDVFEM